MTKERKIKLGVVSVIAILFLVLVFTVFKCNRSQSDYEDKIEALDDSIKVVQIERNFFRTKSEEAIRGHLYADSLLSLKAKNINIQYEKIPDRVRSLNRDSLRAAITNY